MFFKSSPQSGSAAVSRDLRNWPHQRAENKRRQYSVWFVNFQETEMHFNSEILVL